MPLVVRAFPVLPGKDEEMRAFAREAGGQRRAEAAGFFRSFGVVRESWHLQQTPMGSWLIGVTELESPSERGEEYARSERPFDRWFKDQVHRISGINPDLQPLGPPTEMIFEWRDDSAEGESPQAFV